MLKMYSHETAIKLMYVIYIQGVSRWLKAKERSTEKHKM